MRQPRCKKKGVRCASHDCMCDDDDGYEEKFGASNVITEEWCRGMCHNHRRYNSHYQLVEDSEDSETASDVAVFYIIFSASDLKEKSNCGLTDEELETKICIAQTKINTKTTEIVGETQMQFVECVAIVRVQEIRLEATPVYEVCFFLKNMMFML